VCGRYKSLGAGWVAADIGEICVERAAVLSETPSREIRAQSDCTRAPPAALQRRDLRQPGAPSMKLNVFQTVVSNPSWHIGCTTGTRQQTNN